MASWTAYRPTPLEAAVIRTLSGSLAEPSQHAPEVQCLEPDGRECSSAGETYGGRMTAVKPTDATAYSASPTATNCSCYISDCSAKLVSSI